MGALSVLGLSADEERVHEALVTSGTATATQLSSTTGLTGAATTDALSALRQRGLVELLVGPDKRWAATPLEPALDALVHEQQLALAEVRSHAKRLAEIARDQTERVRPDELLAVIEGHGTTQVYFEQLQRLATREVMAFERPPYPDTGGEDPNALQVERIAAGVRYRAVYDRSVLESPSLFRRVQVDLASGEEARVIEGVPLKLAIADRTMALLPLAASEGGTETATLVVRPSVLLDSLVALFESVWVRSVPLLPNTVVTPGADPGLVQVVRLLAAGMGDVRIARVLGTSERTIRRKVAMAMVALGAESRFQAGMLAVRLGWLPQD